MNGTHVSENKYILQNILRDEWKFEGLTMSDWLVIITVLKVATLPNTIYIKVWDI